LRRAENSREFEVLVVWTTSLKDVETWEPILVQHADLPNIVEEFLDKHAAKDGKLVEDARAFLRRNKKARR
jgi:hypothetical protein